MFDIKLTKLQKQIVLIAVMLIAMILVTWLTGLLGRMRFITRSTSGQQDWAGIYVSLGNVIVYLAVLVLGGPWGAAVSAVGAGLGALLLGAQERILGAIVISGIMAFFIAAFCRQCTSWKRSFVVAGIAELIMIVGYFIFDLLVMREFAVAGKAFLVDIGQGIVCGVIGAIILYRLKPMQPSKLPSIRR